VHPGLVDLPAEARRPRRGRGQVGAVTTAEDARRAALLVSDERGHELGSAERARLRPGRLGTERALTLACETLERYGFEPVDGVGSAALTRGHEDLNFPG